MAKMPSIAARAEALLGRSVVATTAVVGGDICTATRLRLNNGRSAFVKTRPRPPVGFFESEATGLRWLEEAGGVPVPGVLAVADDCLILDWIEPGRPAGESAEAFGRALAVTHLAGAARFGAPSNGYVGLLPLVNDASDSWPEFWVRRRIMPYLRAAYDRGSIDDTARAAVERVAARIDELAGPAEPPSRIHGDLWSGNVVWASSGTAHLVDPAAHGGHRETDLAMLALFGTPHLARVLDAYDERAPLADGWRQRVPLHQLHPLLVHAVLFGGSYGQRAGSAAIAVLDGTAAAEP